MTYPLVVMAFDPGQTTGYGVVLLTDNKYELLDAGQLDDPDNVWSKILALINKYKKLYDNVEVLCESFEMRPDVVNPDETPKYIIKDLDRYVAPLHEISYQLASKAKVGVPTGQKGKRDRLHAFRLFQSGKRHANDALRHIISYAIDKHRHRPLIEAGWGVPGKRSR